MGVAKGEGVIDKISCNENKVQRPFSTARVAQQSRRIAESCRARFRRLMADWRLVVCAAAAREWRPRVELYKCEYEVRVRVRNENTIEQETVHRTRTEITSPVQLLIIDQSQRMYEGKERGR